MRTPEDAYVGTRCQGDSWPNGLTVCKPGILSSVRTLGSRSLTGCPHADRNLRPAGLPAGFHGDCGEGVDTGCQAGEGVLERLLVGDEQNLVSDAKLNAINRPIGSSGPHQRCHRRSVFLIEG